MRLRFLFVGLLSLIVVSCSFEEMMVLEDNRDSSATEFYATIDEQSYADTKVYADDQLRVLWNEDDRITIFNKNTYNQQYRFSGEDGDNAGGFKKIECDDEFITSNPLEHIYAVYPYRESNRVSNDGVLTASIPSEQNYKEASFGVGANTMAALSESNMLKFKNVGGYLSLKFYGEGVSVSSITLKSNNGELIAGDCTIDMSSGIPVTSLITSDATDEITLTCDPPVDLGSTSADATQFIFVLPPVTLSGGFTVTVTTPEGGVFVKSSDSKRTIGRSAITKMGALEVVLDENPEYEWVTLSEALLGSYSNGANGYRILDNKFYLSKIRIDKTASYSISYICTLFLSDVDPSFAAYWSQFWKTYIVYGYQGLDSNLDPAGSDDSPTQKFYGESISDSIIEFDLSQLAQKIYLYGYQYNVNLSGIQVYVKKGDYNVPEAELVSEFSLSGVDSFAYDYASYDRYSPIALSSSLTVQENGGVNIVFPKGARTSYENKGESGRFLPSVGMLSYSVTQPSLDLSGFQWSLAGSDAGNGADTGWSHVIKNVDLKGNGRINVSFSISSPNYLSSSSPFSSMALMADNDSGTSLCSDWLFIRPADEKISHLAFNGSNATDLFSNAYDAVANAPSVKLIYNGGPINLANLLSIYAYHPESDDFVAFDLSELNEKYPSYTFRFSLVPYTIGMNNTSEDMYGQVEGTVFTPCYVTTSSGTPVRVVINKGSEDGISSVGRMPLVLATLEDENTGEVVSVGYFRIEITRRDSSNVIKYMEQTIGNKPLDICVIPEGFTEAELDQFVSLASEGMDFLFATEPFKTYKDYFNVYFLKVASQESGASITDGSGNITTQKQTYFNARWGESSYSDMTADKDVVYNFVSANCPEIVNGALTIKDVPILMIINDTRYGGICHSVSDGRGFGMVPYTYSGGTLSWNFNSTVASQNEPVPSGSNYNDYVGHLSSDELNSLGKSIGSWKNTLVHEFGGHCFARLMDEYWYTNYYTSQNTISNHTWPVPFGLNISGYYDSVPWDELLSNQSSLVSRDANYGRIGKFQGAQVSIFNRWRSEMVSCMIDNRTYFSTWQRILIVKKIMEKAGMAFSMDSFFNKDVTVDPLRDGASSLTLGIDPSRPVYEVPLLPPPVLTED